MEEAGSLAEAALNVEGEQLVRQRAAYALTQVHAALERHKAVFSDAVPHQGLATQPRCTGSDVATMVAAMLALKAAAQQILESLKGSQEAL